MNNSFGEHHEDSISSSEVGVRNQIIIECHLYLNIRWPMTILATTKRKRTPDPAVQTGYDIAQNYEEELLVLSVLEQETYEERWREQPDHIADTSRENAENIASEVVDSTLNDAQNVTVRGVIRRTGSRNRACCGGA